MLQINQVSKSYGRQELFQNISLQMEKGERLALVGRNGFGKSTLLKIILGQEEADHGDIIFPKNYRLGYLEQHIDFKEDTVLYEAARGLPPGEEDHLYKVESILFGLGFSAEDIYASPLKFSGGYQIRINLAKVLVNEANLLLLDEPSNYLDIVSMRWLIGFLKQWPGELIVVSHDRQFIDQICTHTALIHRKNLRRCKGNTQKLYDKVLEEETIHEKTRQNELKKRQKTEEFINRFRAKASKASSVQSKIKQLAKLPSLDELAQIDSLDFSFHYDKFSAKHILEVNNLSFAYPHQETLFHDLNFRVGQKDRIGIIGKNGKGKSSLLRILAEELHPTSGSVQKHEHCKLAYFGQSNIQRLNLNLSIEEEVGTSNTSLSRTQVRNICGTMMFSGDHAEKKIKVLSGGERSRVLLAKLLAQPSNLLFLDEPTNHLDLESIQALKNAIDEYPGALLMVTHDEDLLRSLCDKLLIFHRNRLEYFLGDYDEFLDKLGWEEEEKKIKKKKKNKAAPKLKPQNRVSQKIQKSIEDLETMIQNEEKELQDIQEALEKANQEQAIDDIIQLGHQLNEIQKNIDEHYMVLAQLEEELIESQND